MRTARLVLASLALFGVAGCSDLPLRPAGAGATRVELVDTPFFPQEQYQCGPAALATVLVATGIATDADALVPEVYLPARKGSLQAELLAATRRHARLPYVIDPDPAALLAELDAGHPVLVLQNFGSRGHPVWHYAVVIGYERGAGRLILRSGTTRRQELAVRRFLATWQRADRWGFVALRPGELPAHANAARYLRAASDLESAAQPQAVARSYAAAVARWPEQPLAWFAFANARLNEGQPGEAEEAYRRVLALDPSHLAARNNLALLLAKRGCHDFASREIERARAEATGRPLADEVAASTQEIAALRTTVRAAPAAQCVWLN